MFNTNTNYPKFVLVLAPVGTSSDCGNLHVQESRLKAAQYTSDEPSTCPTTATTGTVITTHPTHATTKATATTTATTTTTTTTTIVDQVTTSRSLTTLHRDPVSCMGTLANHLANGLRSGWAGVVGEKLGESGGGGILDAELIRPSAESSSSRFVECTLFF